MRGAPFIPFFVFFFAVCTVIQAGEDGVPCEDWSFEGYRLGMTDRQARAVRSHSKPAPVAGLKFSSNTPTDKKVLRHEFTVGRKSEGWRGTVTIKNNELVKFWARYTDLSLEELVAWTTENYGEPVREGDRYLFRSHRCGAIVIVEPAKKQGSRLTLQDLGEYIVQKYK